MKHFITTIISCSLCVLTQAQNVGINTPTPKTSLDIKGGIRNQPLYLTGSGTAIIIPDNQSNINLEGSFSGPFSATVNNPEDGQRLIIDNNSNQKGALIGGPDIRDGLNEYIFSDGEWKTVKTNAWDLNGNFNTNPATQFLGTTDKNDVVFKTFDTEKMRLHHQGGLSIGTPIHTEALDLNGNTNISGEIMPLGVAGSIGQVLQSNGNGTMQWVNNTANSDNGNENVGYGSWGDCSLNNITAYQPVTGDLNGVFGYAVAISGGYAITGNPFNNPNYGEATILQRNTTSGIWEKQSQLADIPLSIASGYGSSVSISGDYAIVGSYQDDLLGLENTGSATIYKRNSSNNTWARQIKFNNNNPVASDNFGVSVSISGDFAIVGASADEDLFFNSGSATIYRRNGSDVWVSEGKITNPGPQGSEYFGTSVSISGDYAIVGTPLDDEGAGKTDNGSATIFKRNSISSIWESQGKMVKYDAQSSENFGKIVSISGNLAVVGSNESVSFYQRNTSTNVWELKYLTKDNPSSISISGDYVIIGFFSPYQAKIYKRDITGFWLVQKFTQPNADGTERFGSSVAIDGSSKRFIVGTNSEVFSKVYFGKVK